MPPPSAILSTSVVASVTLKRSMAEEVETCRRAVGAVSLVAAAPRPILPVLLTMRRASPKEPAV